MRYAAICLLLVVQSLVTAEPDNNYSRYHIGAGYSPTIYYTVFSMEFQNAIDINYNYEIIRNLNVKSGLRAGFSPFRPEAYIGFNVRAFDNVWQPSIGLEIGLTGRAKFGEGLKLLRETRKAMEQPVSPVYMAVQSAPLTFSINDALDISFLEIHLGTHLVHPGRTLRFQLGIFSIGKKL